MGPRNIHHRRIASGVLAGGLLLVPLTGCGDTSEPDVDATPETSMTESAPAEDTSAPAETSAAEDAGGNADVNCSGSSCSVTLSGDGAEATILGTTIALGTVGDGRATVRVGDQEVSCSEGESVSAGPLTLECTTVDQDAVTMTASLG